MADRSSVVLAARLALLPVSLALAAAAFVHAGSETETFWLGPGTSGRLGLDAHITAGIVDNAFRAEAARLQPQASTPDAIPRLPDALIALARTSYAVDPWAVTSLRTIALGSVLQDDEGRARQLMRIAVQLSKRDSITNMWLAQDYGRAGDVEAMIASFDYALRTSARARSLAMKPLVGTLASEESHKTIGGLLAQHPAWEFAFWREFVQNPVALARAADFFEATSIPLEELDEQYRTALYANLKKRRQFDALYRIAAIDRDARVGAKMLAEGKFVSADEGYPLGWTLRSQGNFATRIHQETDELRIDGNAGSFGIAADRVVRGGRDYRLVIKMAEAMPENARIRLSVRCADEANRELASLSVGSGARTGEVAFSAEGCAFANLALSFTVDPGRRDALIRIANIALRPA
jgi:hypothetical protein